jgi:REP element-mobilizing transposase RayT
MPRKARIDAPGALHHIIVRGIERKDIFKDQKDKTNFLDRLELILTETSTPCFAWALMPNHVHLLLRTGLTSIATIMRRLLTGYAQQFNRRHRRHGQLFQNRYKSFLCEEDAYLLELVRYIHLNPLRAGLVESMDDLNHYPGSGHSALMGKVERKWQDVGYILNYFGKKEGAARGAYLEYIIKGVTLGRRPDLVGGGLVRSAGGWKMLKGRRRAKLRMKGDERILGSGDFVEAVLKKANEDFEQRTLLKVKGPGLDALIRRVCRYFDVEPEEIKNNSKYRMVSRARALVCFLATRKLMISNVKVANSLNISPSAVSKASARGQKDKAIDAIQRKVFGNIAFD